LTTGPDRPPRSPSARRAFAAKVARELDRLGLK
jgi:hypothetical protein